MKTLGNRGAYPMNETMEQIIIEILTENLSPFLIVLFGSTAKGSTHKDSDVDIAFLSNDIEVDKYKLFLIAQEMAPS